MFPLGSVLLPGAPLQLQIFEQRYRIMLADCLAGDACFGVVLIERGHEVGGGDQRADVGTVAQIMGTGDLGEGRSALLAVGTRRIRIEQWLPDDPYPRAEVVDWPDGPIEATAQLVDRYDHCTERLRQLLALADRMGQPAPSAALDAPDDPVAGSHLLAALLPVGAFDRQKLLCAPDAGVRLDLLSHLIDDHWLFFEHDADPS